MKQTKTVYTANKHSYCRNGNPFLDVCNTLDELKRAIVKQETFFSRLYYDREWTDDMYTEELFKKYKEEGDYHLRKICLHKDEKIEFTVDDGKSSFYIVKKEPNILSYIMIFNPKE